MSRLRELAWEKGLNLKHREKKMPNLMYKKKIHIETAVRYH